MTRLVIALVLGSGLALGCSGAAKPATTTGAGAGSGPSGPPLVAKRVTVSWGIQQNGGMADLFLQTTDETGSQVSHELGTWSGTCAVSTPAANMNALTAVSCRTGGTGTELQAVPHGGDEIVIMKMGIDEGVMPDPMAREEVTRIKVPLGAKIEAGS